MSDELTLAILIFLAVDTVAAIFLVAAKIAEKRKRRKISHFGDRAEEMVSDYIDTNFPNSVQFRDILLKGEKGLVEIDHLLICRWGVFVIETKSHNGRIVIGEKEWVQYYGDKIVKFHSPLLQNETHVKAVKNVLQKTEFAKTKVKGLVVFTSDKVYFPEKARGVIRLSRLNITIKHGSASGRYKPVTARIGAHYLSREKIAKIAAIIKANTDTSFRHRRDHDEKIANLSKFSAYKKRR